MVVTVTLKYLSTAPSGHLQYRRRVPASLQPYVGKGEYKRVMKASEGVALAREHVRVDAEFDRAMKAADAQRLRSAAAASGAVSPRQLWVEAQRRADALLVGVHGLDEDDARGVLAENIAAAYPFDPDDGEPLGVSAADALLMKALRAPSAPPPPLTLLDARDIYAKVKLREGSAQPETKNLDRVNRMMREVETALGKIPALAELNRSDARKVLDHMKALRKSDGEPLSQASVKRNLSTIKAIINFAAEEFGLTKTLENPFNGRWVDTSNDATVEGENRDPLPLEVLRAVRERVLGHASPELGLIWRMLQGTGCRLGEVTGLRVQDLSVSDAVPHMRITWHEGRRLKTKASRRHVPLVGDVLVAAVHALAMARDGDMLFPTYGDGGRGATNASAALMRHVRKVTTDRRHVIHSLRHNAADWLREAPERDRNIILGHALGGVGERVYGGKPEELRATSAALREALAKAARQGFPGTGMDVPVSVAAA